MNLSIPLTTAANVWMYMHISWVFLHLNLSILNEEKISNYSDNDDDNNNDNNDKLCNNKGFVSYTNIVSDFYWQSSVLWYLGTIQFYTFPTGLMHVYWGNLMKHLEVTRDDMSKYTLWI